MTLSGANLTFFALVSLLKGLPIYHRGYSQLYTFNDNHVMIEDIIMQKLAHFLIL